MLSEKARPKAAHAHGSVHRDDQQEASVHGAGCGREPVCMGPGGVAGKGQEGRSGGVGVMFYLEMDAGGFQLVKIH